MAVPPRRPFRLLDAMTLVAATAVGLGLARGVYRELWSQTNMNVGDGSAGAVLLATARWTALGVPLIAVWTIALLVLDLQRPQPRLRALFHRSGTAACGAATLAIVIEVVNLTALLVVLSVRQSMSKYPPFGLDEVLVAALIHGVGINLGMPGLAVAVAWVTSALGGHWQPAQDWLDRAGRWLGVVWIAVMVLAPWMLLTFGGAFS